MARKRKPVSNEIKLQALDEVDKKVKSKTQIAKEYGVPFSTRA
jgi:transposase-like protein